MLQALVVIGVVAIALLVGQSYPLLGGLIATFPIKIFAYLFGAPAENTAEGIRGLLIGSLASTACAGAMWLAIGQGLQMALGVGLVAWMVCAALGRLLI